VYIGSKIHPAGRRFGRLKKLRKKLRNFRFKTLFDIFLVSIRCVLNMGGGASSQASSSSGGAYKAADAPASPSKGGITKTTSIKKEELSTPKKEAPLVAIDPLQPDEKVVSNNKLKKMALGIQGYKDQQRDYDVTLNALDLNKTSHVEWSEPKPIFTPNRSAKEHSQLESKSSTPQLFSPGSSMMMSPAEKRKIKDAINSAEVSNNHSSSFSNMGPPRGTNSNSFYLPPNNIAVRPFPKDRLKASSDGDDHFQQNNPPVISGKQPLHHQQPNQFNNFPPNNNMSAGGPFQVPMKGHPGPGNGPAVMIAHAPLSHPPMGNVAPNNIMNNNRPGSSQFPLGPIAVPGSGMVPPMMAGLPVMNGPPNGPPIMGPRGMMMVMTPGGQHSPAPHHHLIPVTIMGPGPGNANIMQPPSSSSSTAIPPNNNNNSNLNNARPPTSAAPVPAVKETKNVKRNRVQLPQNMSHAKPTTGDWLNKRYFVNNYILLDTLGVGSYGEVRMCKERVTDKLFAIKIISKEFLKKKKGGKTSETYFEDIKREIAIMKKLLHPNVLRLYEVLDDPKVSSISFFLNSALIRFN
jgi:hypothetical protein